MANRLKNLGDPVAKKIEKRKPTENQVEDAVRTFLLAPITGFAHIGYLPKGRVVGISKLARVVDAFARRL